MIKSKRDNWALITVSFMLVCTYVLMAFYGSGVFYLLPLYTIFIVIPLLGVFGLLKWTWEPLYGGILGFILYYQLLIVNWYIAFLIPNNLRLMPSAYPYEHLVILPLILLAIPIIKKCRKGSI